jgi:hypothetical protein
MGSDAGDGDEHTNQRRRSMIAEYELRSSRSAGRDTSEMVERDEWEVKFMRAVDSRDALALWNSRSLLKPLSNRVLRRSPSVRIRRSIHVATSSELTYNRFDVKPAIMAMSLDVHRTVDRPVG